MFIFNNINDREYNKIFTEQKNVIFDLSDRQIENGNNSEWKDIKCGDVACVISSSRKVSTIYKIEAIKEYGPVLNEEGHLFVLIGKIIAKALPEMDMTNLLNKHGVVHKKLPDNKFSIGFNVANLGTQLDKLNVKTQEGECTLGELIQKCHSAFQDKASEDN
ncbi:hypothetical protein PCO86_13080 [Pectobacteriaceae bacterium CE70]|nr:hypothetical protein PCO86_13080 [Pectobacteriaceae bacterium CE70]WJY09276.1 hypothetical protein PCO80_12955 [Pectobacteriaceae bacterium C80]